MMFNTKETTDLIQAVNHMVEKPHLKAKQHHDTEDSFVRGVGGLTSKLLNIFLKLSKLFLSHQTF